MERNDRKPQRTSQLLDRESKFIMKKVILDVLVLVCVCLLILAFHLWGKPYKRGFFCDDESLKHPYKDSTVTSLMLYLIGLGLPIVTMFLIEWLRLRDHKGRPRVVFGMNIPPWLWEVYTVVGIFLFGCACQQLTTNVAKYTIGRLRPHFFDICDPDIDCGLPENKWKYIENFNCRRTTDDKLMKEMRLSFPSGHSSFSTYTMIYLALYLHRRITWRGSKLIRHAIQLILFLMCWYTVMSRVSDYKHHWSDVLAGFGIGLMYAVVVFLYMSNLRKSARRQTAQVDSELTTNGNSRPGGWQV